MSKLTFQATSDDPTLPLYYPDTIMNPGTLWCFDLSNPACWDPAATVANNAQVTNLVSGAPPAKIKNPSGALSYVAGKGFQKTANDVTHYLELSPGTDYLQANLTHDFLFMTWTTRPVSDPSAVSGIILAKQAGAIATAGMFLTASGGYASSGRMDCRMSGNTALNTDLTASGVYAAGAAAGVHMMGFARVGTAEYLIRDGAVVTSGGIPINPSTGLPWVYAADAAALTFMAKPADTAGSGINGLIGNRTWGEDLTLSAAAATTYSGVTVTPLQQMQAQILAEFNSVTGRFT